MDHVMGHDETPFRLELKDPRCGSQIKHKSNPNYEQVLFIKSHYGVSRWLRLRLLSGGTRSARLSSFSEPPHFCCLRASLQADICIFLLSVFIPKFRGTISLQSLASRKKFGGVSLNCGMKCGTYVITFPGGIYVFIL